MNYERAYKEALERARESYRKSIEQGWTCDKEIYEQIFPELRESDDENIRKELLDYIKRFIPHHDIDLVKKSKVWIAWLEKQGEKSWSKEDEKMLNSIIEEIRPFGECPDYPTDEDREYYYNRAKMIDWLKSLKPQPRWRPTEEQLKALELKVIGRRDVLYELYLDLQKL